MTPIRVAEEFSPYLGGRYRSDGPYSGEEFRDRILVPRVEAAIAGHSRVKIIFDGVAGMPSSFLEEAFGGLLRRMHTSATAVRGALDFQADDPELLPFIALAKRFMDQEIARAH